MAPPDAADAFATDPRLSGLARAAAPAMVVDGEGGVVWSNDAASGLADGEALDEAGRRTIARIAASGSEGLARLRIGAGRRRESLTFRSSRLRLDDGRRCVLLEGLAPLPDAPAAALPDVASLEGAEGGAPFPAATPADDLGDGADSDAARGAGDGAAPADEDAPPDPRRALRPPDDADGAKASADADAIDAAQRPEPEPRRHLRFAFEFDAAGRLALLSPELSAAVGPGADRAVGRDWTELAEALALDPEGAVQRALEARRGWSDLAIRWPTPDGGRLPLLLSALPIFDNGRAFVGFRGLGRAGEAAGATTRGETTARETGEPEAAGPPAPEDLVAGAALTGADAETAADPSGAEAVAIAGPEPTIDVAPSVDRGAAAGAAEDARREGPARGASGASQQAEAFRGNVVPLRDAAARAPAAALSTVEESAFDEIARRLRGLGVRTSPTPEPDAGQSVPERDYPETAELRATPPSTDDWTIDDVEGRAPTVSRVDDLLRLLDRLPVGAIVLRAGEVVHANRAALEMTGHPDLASLASRGAETLFGEALPRDDAAPATLPLIARDGVELEVEARLAAISWEGAPATLVSLKRAEGAVAAAFVALQREREISEILDTATDGVLTLDSAGRILSANRSAEALFGFDAREAIGSLFTLSLAPESRSAAFDYLDSLKANGVAAVMNDGREVLGLARQGGAIPLYMTLGRIGPADDKRYCAVLRDITPWKKAEEELIAAKRQAERASAQKSDFLAKVSHEIRTPLNAIIGFAEVMMEERFGPIGNARYKDYLRDIHVSGEQLIGLVNDLLDLTKVESGHMKLDFASVDLNEIVSQAVALLQPQANREHVILRASLARNLPPVLGDRRSLRQVLTNLVSNAVRLSRPGGQVIVATAYTDVGQAVARVRDAGAGMSKRDVARALEPFGRSNAGEPDVGSSLPLTKALIEANHAIFTIDSRIGEGTLVEVTFPGSRVLAG